MHRALVKAEFEPYLGFLHPTAYSKPSLVCDFQELYRYLIDGFLIERCRKLRKKGSLLVTDFMVHLRMGKRIHLCDYATNELTEALDSLLERIVEVPRTRIGSRETIETLVSEEALLFAKFPGMKWRRGFLGLQGFFDSLMRIQRIPRTLLCRGKEKEIDGF